MRSSFPRVKTQEQFSSAFRVCTQRRASASLWCAHCTNPPTLLGGPNEHFEVVVTTCTTCCNIKQDRQRSTCNSEERLRNYGCSGKALNYYIFWVCVCSLSYPACKVHALGYVDVCGLSGSATFFRIISKKVRFFRKIITEHQMCVLIFSTPFVRHFSF
jgi:hypothetical protein